MSANLCVLQSPQMFLKIYFVLGFLNGSCATYLLPKFLTRHITWYHTRVTESASLIYIMKWLVISLLSINFSWMLIVIWRTHQCLQVTTSCTLFGMRELEGKKEEEFGEIFWIGGIWKEGIKSNFIISKSLQVERFLGKWLFYNSLLLFSS